MKYISRITTYCPLSFYANYYIIENLLCMKPELSAKKADSIKLEGVSACKWIIPLDL